MNIEELEDRYARWMERRRGKITSSKLPDLIQKGRGCEFGGRAMAEMRMLCYERRTGISRAETTARSLRWGLNNEPLALQWVKEQFLGEVKSCCDDFEEIVFNEPFEGFGDSTDFYLYDFSGRKEAAGEIKCPTSQSEIEELWHLEAVDSGYKNYWQCLGHFLGNLDVDKVLLVIYDAYIHEGRILEMHRADYTEDLKLLRQRIKIIHEAVNFKVRNTGE